MIYEFAELAFVIPVLVYIKSHTLQACTIGVSDNFILPMNLHDVLQPLAFAHFNLSRNYRH